MKLYITYSTTTLDTHGFIKAVMDEVERAGHTFVSRCSVDNIRLLGHEPLPYETNKTSPQAVRSSIYHEQLKLMRSSEAMIAFMPLESTGVGAEIAYFLGQHPDSEDSPLVLTLFHPSNCNFHPPEEPMITGNPKIKAASYSDSVALEKRIQNTAQTIIAFLSGPKT